MCRKKSSWTLKLYFLHRSVLLSQGKSLIGIENIWFWRKVENIRILDLFPREVLKRHKNTLKMKLIRKSKHFDWIVFFPADEQPFVQEQQRQDPWRSAGLRNNLVFSFSAVIESVWVRLFCDHQMKQHAEVKTEIVKTCFLFSWLFI